MLAAFVFAAAVISEGTPLSLPCFTSHHHKALAEGLCSRWITPAKHRSAHVRSPWCRPRPSRLV